MNKKEIISTLSISDIYELLMLLQLEFISIDIKKNDFDIRYKKKERILTICIYCNFLVLNNKGGYSLTKRGREINNLSQIKITAYREILYDFVYVLKPDWGRKLRNGRTESIKQLPVNIITIFKELELYPHYSADAANWWDKIANSYYAENDKNLKITGRIGEFLTMFYESKRLNNKYEPDFPHHEALESDKAGYDILSKISAEIDENLNIEVKASRDKCNFYLSSGEAKCLKNSKYYELHYWNIKNMKNLELYILNKENIFKVLPINTDIGEWKKCEINIKILKNIVPINFQLNKEQLKEIEILDSD